MQASDLLALEGEAFATAVRALDTDSLCELAYEVAARRQAQPDPAANVVSLGARREAHKRSDLARRLSEDFEALEGFVTAADALDRLLAEALPDLSATLRAGDVHGAIEIVTRVRREREAIVGAPA